MNIRHVLCTFVVVLFATGLVPARAAGPRIVHVFDVDGLYDAVNDPGNAGARVVITAGYYALSPLDTASNVRPNNGSLHLQPDMTLSGKPGHPEAVVIDAVELLEIGGSAVRTGRGSNTIEWLTVKNAARRQSAIDTGLVSTLVARVRLAHLIVEGNLRGFDIRNSINAAGRILQVDLEHNDVSANQIDPGIGIRFVNNGANGAVILARLRRNDLHDNLAGLVAENLNSSGSIIVIDSNADHFDRNRVGGLLLAGQSNLLNALSDGNFLTFDARGSTIRDNLGALSTGDIGGLVVIGGLADHYDRTSNNTLHVGLWATKLSGNQGADIVAWGARTIAALPAGANNHVVVALGGVSRRATNSPPVASQPVEPGGTNTVTIIR